MDLVRIRELLKIVAESDVDEVELEENGVKVVVRKNAATVMVQPAPMMAPYGVGYPSPVLPQAPPAPAVAAPVAASPPPTTLEEPEPDAIAVPADGLLVRAPIVGTYYEAPAPGADPFVSVGEQIKPGDVLCIIEAMKLMNNIEAEHSGEIVEILPEDGSAVQFGDRLFAIRPA